MCKKRREVRHLGPSRSRNVRQSLARPKLPSENMFTGTTGTAHLRGASSMTWTIPSRPSSLMCWKAAGTAGLRAIGDLDASSHDRNSLQIPMDAAVQKGPVLLVLTGRHMLAAIHDARGTKGFCNREISPILVDEHQRFQAVVLAVLSSDFQTGLKLVSGKASGKL